MRPQRLQIFAARVFRRLGEIDGEIDDRALAWCELRGRGIVFDLRDEIVILGDLTEILPVSLGSVVTMIDPGNDRRHHFTLGTRQTRDAVH